MDYKSTWKTYLKDYNALSKKNEPNKVFDLSNFDLETFYKLLQKNKILFPGDNVSLKLDFKGKADNRINSKKYNLFTQLLFRVYYNYNIKNLEILAPYSLLSVNLNNLARLGLNQLTLRDFQLTPSNLQEIGALENLKELVLTGIRGQSKSEFNLSDILNGRMFKNLKKLVILSTYQIDDFIDKLSNFKEDLRLEELQFGTSGIDKASIFKLANSKRLKHLEHLFISEKTFKKTEEELSQLHDLFSKNFPKYQKDYFYIQY